MMCLETGRKVMNLEALTEIDLTACVFFERDLLLLVQHSIS